MFEKLIKMKSWLGGENAQEACFNAGYASGDKVFVALCYRYPSGGSGFIYAAFKDMADLFTYYTGFGNDNRCFYAIDRSQSTPEYKSALYLDIEWFTDGRDKLEPQRLSRIYSALKGALPGLADRDIKTHRFGRWDNSKFKNSFHIHVPSVVFANNAEVGEWVDGELWHDQQLITDQLMMNIDGKPIIDFRVYTNNRYFRLPGSAKEPGDEVPHEGMPSTVQDLLDSVSGWFRPVTHSSKKKKTTRKARFQPLNLSADSSICQAIECMLRNRGDPHTKVVPNAKGAGFVGRTDRVHGRTCLVGDEHNKTDCCFFNVDHLGKVWYHCYDRDAHAYCAGTWLGTLPGGTGDKGHAEALEQGRLWSPGVTEVEHTEKEGYVKPILFNGKRVVAIAAHCGRGKSTSVAKCIKRLAKDTKDFRVLVVSARISHAAVQKDQFQGFVHYKDPKFLEANKVIVQYESLHNLADHGAKAFDIVILDEARSIVDQMLSTETNGRFTGRNARYLYALLGFAQTKVIALDADLETDGCVPTLLQRVARPDEITVHRYTHNPTVRKFYVTRNKQVFMDKLTKDVKSGDKTAIACVTKSAAQVWSQYLSQNRPDLKVLLIHGDVDDSLKTSMQKPNEFLAQFDLLIFTSVVTVGADVQLQWHNLLVDASSRNGCGPRQLLQMIGRFRKLTSIRIDVLYPAKPTKAEQNYSLSYRLKRAQVALRERETDLACYQGMIRFQESFGPDGTLTLAPDWFTEIFVHAHAEKMASFEEEFARQAKRHQFEIVSDEKEMPETKETKEEFMAAKELADEKREEIMKDAFYDLSTRTADELHQRRQDLDERIKKQEASEHEKIECEVLHTLKHFRGDGDHKERNEKRRQLSYEQFKMAHKHKRALFNIAMILKRGLDHDEVLAPLRNKLRDNEYVNIPTATLPYLSAISTVQVLELVGVKEAGLKKESYFTKADIIAKRQEIIELTNRAARVGGKRIRSSVKSDKVAKDMAHEPLTGLRRALESSFGAKIKGVKMTKTEGRNKREIYTIEQNKDLVDLAMISNAYEADNIDVAVIKGQYAADVSIEPPPKKRRSGVHTVHAQIRIDDAVLALEY